MSPFKNYGNYYNQILAKKQENNRNFFLFSLKPCGFQKFSVTSFVKKINFH